MVNSKNVNVLAKLFGLGTTMGTDLECMKHNGPDLILWTARYSRLKNFVFSKSIFLDWENLVVCA